MGDRNGIRPVKRLCVGLLVVTFLLELCMCYSSSCYHQLHTSITLSCNKIQNGDILVSANPSPPGKSPLKLKEIGYIECYESVRLSIVLTCELFRSG